MNIYTLQARCNVAIKLLIDLSSKYPLRKLVSSSFQVLFEEATQISEHDAYALSYLFKAHFLTPYIIYNVNISISHSCQCLSLTFPIYPYPGPLRTPQIPSSEPSSSFQGTYVLPYALRFSMTV